MKKPISRSIKHTSLLAISASLAAIIVMASDDTRTDVSDSLTPSPLVATLNSTGSEADIDKRDARLRHSYDAGDFYYYQGERMPLRRSLTELVVEFRQGISEQRKRKIVDSIFLDAELLDEGPVRGRQVNRVELVEPLPEATLDDALTALRGWSEVKYAFAVFVHPQNGGTAALTDELIVKLRPGVDLEAVIGAVGPDTLTPVKKIWGTNDQYILRVKAPKRFNPLQLANQLVVSAPVEWATPNFLQRIQFDYTPSDPLYPQQWHLNNEGELGAYLETVQSSNHEADLELHSPADADVDAPEAWDLEQGNETIVIAIVDSGVDLQHEDLVDNLFINEGEIPENGIDDDGNGFVDDVTGWDFYDENNKPNDQLGHGTAVAGVAAASTDNAIGVAGICPQCRILPVSLGRYITDDAGISEAIHYAASFADVLNGSWHRAYPVDVITSALQDATSLARDGKGAISLFASGNSASSWRLLSDWQLPGNHRYRLTYSKDEDGSAGEDTVWLAWVAMPIPDGELVTFEDGIPADWQTSGDAPWTVVEDVLHADESVCYAHALKAGAIGDGEQSHLDIIVEHEKPFSIWFSFWISSESPGDKFEVTLDRWNDGTVDQSIGQASGLPMVWFFDVNYPASLPDTVAVGASSSWDCRIGYSQFGVDLDFLAPSGGEVLANYITTTDITGGAGFVHTNYVTVQGTSFASPQAAGIAGLILSTAPELTAQEVRQLMRETADKIGPEPYVDGRNDRYGYGRLNAHRAVAVLTGEQQAADLVLNKTAEEDKVRLREDLGYTLTVTNEGPSEATNVTVKDTLPQEVTLEETSEECAIDKGMLICSVESLPAGQSKAFEFEVTVSRVPEDRLLINKATVTADQSDVNLSDNTAEAVTLVIGRKSQRESEDKREQDHTRGRKTVR